ncbi:hypothetical protein [Lysinibacillus sphaericus]|uniref:hypothetical protein n=1 Tax=Lysinibacillus sphaericus TaxID=1421 RepID=UPI000C19992F|nr:hypothetical protein [Lysinibacillus sphaericus]PIJ95830.1 hypothetical protein CTN02_21960 [Lysinibacillus sphaericus]
MTNPNKNIYVPGQSTSFTPSRSATWIDEFNRILGDSPLSRNKLTEELIMAGLKSWKGFSTHLVEEPDHINSTNNFNFDFLTKSENELLSTHYYQEVIKRFINILISENEEGIKRSFLNFPPSPINENETVAQVNTNQVNSITPSTSQKEIKLEEEQPKKEKANLNAAMALWQSTKQ